MEPVNFVYMTASGREEALAVGRELVAHKLAACINVIGQVESVFAWEGEIQQEAEVVLIAKTTEARMPELVEKVREIHSYDCPCIVSLPASGGNPDFLEWIGQAVATA